jgi:hypothetical protein
MLLLAHHLQRLDKNNQFELIYNISPGQKIYFQ